MGPGNSTTVGVHNLTANGRWSFPVPHSFITDYRSRLVVRHFTRVILRKKELLAVCDGFLLVREIKCEWAEEGLGGQRQRFANRKGMTEIARRQTAKDVIGISLLEPPSLVRSFVVRRSMFYYKAEMPIDRLAGWLLLPVRWRESKKYVENEICLDLTVPIKCLP